jgi:hypothetical protein
MISTLLDQTLAAVALERRRRFDRSGELAQRLAEEFGTEELAERLYEAIQPECAWELVAELFALLVWRTSDNGRSICAWAEQQLREAADDRRIRIALHLGAYPFADREQMRLTLACVAKRYPALAERCSELVANRERSAAAGRYPRMKLTRRGFEGGCWE